MAAISPQDRYVRVDSINTRYRIQGAGSPVVLIHGIGPPELGSQLRPPRRASLRVGARLGRQRPLR